MELADVKQFLEEHSEDQEVAKFLDSIADKRVTQARQKWEQELDEKVEQEIQRRQEAEKVQAERMEEIDNRFKAHSIDPELGRRFLDDVGALSDEDLEPAVEKAIEQAKDVQERLIKTRFAGKAPEAPAEKDEGGEATEFRRAMGLES